MIPVVIGNKGSPHTVEITWCLLRAILGRVLYRPGGLNRSEEMPHVEREVVDAIVVRNCSRRAEVDAFLSRVGRNV